MERADSDPLRQQKSRFSPKTSTWHRRPFAICSAWSLLAAGADGSSSSSSLPGVRPRSRSSLDDNPACWTDGYDWNRCCGPDGEGGCFVEDNPYEPHTRSRCCESPCGSALRARIEAEGAARCKRRQKWNETLVVGLWNLNRHRWKAHTRYKEGDGRSYARYLEWMDKILEKRQALLLFVDAEAATFAAERRESSGLSHLTCILEVPIEDLPQMKWRDDYKAAHDENKRQLPGDTQPEVIYEDYTLVVNSKPELLGCAALWNPFRSKDFAWVDAGSGRKDGFPPAKEPIRLPNCPSWTLCVGRRMWLFFDFHSKLKRLKHGTTFDTTVLAGGREGVLLYALWFQWAVGQYLAEKVMDDEQSIIAEVWWTGRFNIKCFFGMQWSETLAQMVQATYSEDLIPPGTDAISMEYGKNMGRWFGAHPDLLWKNTGFMWIPFTDNLSVVEQVQVNTMNDDHLERLAYGLWCQNKRFGYYQSFCESMTLASSGYINYLKANGLDLGELPMVEHGNRLMRGGVQQN